MAMESPCNLRIGRDHYHGTARMESEHIDFAGTTKFRFRFSEMRNPGRADGMLTFDFHGNAVRMDLGDRTERWLESILHPKTLAEKLGARPGHTVRMIGIEDAALLSEFDQKRIRVVESDWDGPCDLILVGVDRPSDLRQISRLADDLAAEGAIWAVLPKSSKTVTHANVLAAARVAGLADTRTISFSDTHAGYRLVIPPGRRASHQSAERSAARNGASPGGAPARGPGNGSIPASDKARGPRGVTRRRGAGK